MNVEKAKLLNQKCYDRKLFWKALKGKRPNTKLNFENIELSHYFEKLSKCDSDKSSFSNLECDSNINDEIAQLIDYR